MKKKPVKSAKLPDKLVDLIVESDDNILKTTKADQLRWEQMMKR